nr:OmpA family protein [uncultured Desulfovibrio sp.]
MFQPGSATLSPQGIKVLGSVIKILREYNLYLVVRGHADSAEAQPNYPSGWELSGARAAAALHYLSTDGHIKPTTLRGICYGDTRPYKPGTNETSRAANRRVEFVFHRPEVMSYSVVY